MSAIINSSRAMSLGFGSHIALKSAMVSNLRINRYQLNRFYSSKFPDHTVIAMPALSPTMTQGNIARWTKKVGDQLEPGESIAEIETDKAVMDFEFQEDGYLAKILLQDGASDIPVGKPIAVYVESADDVAAFDGFTAEDAGDSSAGAAAKPEPQESKEQEQEQEQEQPKADTSSKSSQSTTPKVSTDRIIASPLAKTIALDKGISLKNITGSGPNGRIVAKDVENYKPSAAATSGPSPGASSVAGASFEDIPLSSMRKTIASRLLSSTQGIPSYFVTSQISVGKLLKLRQSLNSTAEDRYRLSINDLLIKAIAAAALKVPQVNSAWLGNEGVIRQYANVDVSVAVATSTGLITPIVKNAHIKGLAAISNEVKDLGKRAKAGKLQPEEYQGGTICISNLGMNPAVNHFTSIINPPQSSILAIGTVEKKAVPSDVNEQGFIFDDFITITGTFDHRVTDGALGGDFMRELKKIIENPLELLI